jgi:U4/U6.U5 tri-snRNP-associated protein 1
MSEDVVFSIAETNKLRAELGLAPLRLSNEPQQQQHGGGSGGGDASASPATGSEEVLAMSVQETNDLRATLGLKPLSTSSATTIIHKPAENDGAAKEAEERIQKAKLQRDVQRGITETFGSSTLADEADKSALSWAERMRQQTKDLPPTNAKETKASNGGKQSKASKSDAYGDQDLQGIQVSHKMSEIEAGSTTILTLADAPLLQTKDGTSKRVVGLNDGAVALENVNLAEQSKQQDGLRKKRLLELGMGRAGGYAGFDDEEFEELGGTLGPARQERSSALPDDMEDEDGTGKSSRGFRIGIDPNKGDASMNDFDKMQHGKAISLMSTKADVAASDYMTLEEEEAERAQKKQKKDGKFKMKKKKKKDKKDKKRRRTQVESDDDEEEATPSSKPNLLEQLEETAAPETSALRKRRRSDSDDDDDDDDGEPSENGKSIDRDNGNAAREKRSKYDAIMAKGNERTRLAFQAKTKPKPVEEFEEEPDDYFLNAALAKARRLNRLRELSQAPSKGADAVAEAVKSSQINQENPDTTASSNGTLSFSIDDTREFTRAIRARAQQKEREAEKKAKQVASTPANVIVKQEEKEEPSTSSEAKERPQVEDVQPEEEEEGMDIEELAKEVTTEDVPAIEGATDGERAGVGRGLASFVTMLKTTGEISSKRSGKEELRGRAKDERNYENYEPLDLSQVVKIGKNATGLDKELANREIKLEYRDKHGRLLTAKEAYRDLCYQFHGHGGSKKKEDKRLKQIAREQAEARMASGQVTAARDGTAAGTLGALKATQKATGKAFIVHKT